jgi:hypothetical protein
MAAAAKPALTARISLQAPPDVDPTRTIPAFGDRAVPRLSRELAPGNDLITVQRALFTLCDLLRDPKTVSEAIAAGLPTQLGGLVEHPNATVREKASEALVHVAGHAVGRAAIVQLRLVPVLAAKFLDELAIVRLNTHECVERVSKAREGATEVIQLGLIPKLVAQAGDEAEVQVKEVVLDTLHNAAQVNSVPGLECGGMDTFMKLLGHGAPSVVARAARNIMDTAVTLPGKEEACTKGAIALLVGLLDGRRTASEPEVVAAACSALMTVTITTEGKKTALKDGLVDRLPALLGSADERVLLTGIKLITTTSEAPAARRALQSVVPRLTELKAFRGTRLDEMAVARSAQTAIDTITWTP